MRRGSIRHIVLANVFGKIGLKSATGTATCRHEWASSGEVSGPVKGGVRRSSNHGLRKWEGYRIVHSVNVQEVIEQLESLPPPERAEVLRQTLSRFCPRSGQAVERLLRRLVNPDVPEDVWRGIEDAEDGRVADMETALTEKPPWLA